MRTNDCPACNITGTSSPHTCHINSTPPTTREATHNTRELEELVEEFRNVGAICVDKRQTECGEITTWQGGASDEQCDWLRTTLHHQLQKARRDWLREEIKELQSWGGIGWSADDYYNEVKALVDRYQTELDDDGITPYQVKRDLSNR